MRFNTIDILPAAQAALARARAGGAARPSA